MCKRIGLLWGVVLFLSWSICNRGLNKLRYQFLHIGSCRLNIWEGERESVFRFGGRSNLDFGGKWRPRIGWIWILPPQWQCRPLPLLKHHHLSGLHTIIITPILSMITSIYHSCVRSHSHRLWEATASFPSRHYTFHHHCHRHPAQAQSNDGRRSALRRVDTLASASSLATSASTTPSFISSMTNIIAPRQSSIWSHVKRMQQTIWASMTGENNN